MYLCKNMENKFIILILFVVSSVSYVCFSIVDITHNITNVNFTFIQIQVLNNYVFFISL